MELTELRARVENELALGVTQAELARQVGVSPAVISQWMNRAYRGDVAGLETKLMGWLEQRSSRQAVQWAGGPQWVETLTARRIQATLSYAQSAADLVVIYGAPGVGKTIAVTHYAEQYGNIWLATMTAATTSAVTALEEVMTAVGLEPAGGAARMQRALIKRLRGTEGLLIIDEAQHLSLQALEALRGLYDATGIGLAFVGNELVYTRLTGGTRQAQFAQLFSRIGKRLRLDRPPSDDVSALAAAWGLDSASRKAIDRIAATPGALRSCTKALRLAHVLACGGKETLGANHIEMAWRDLGCRQDREG